MLKTDNLPLACWLHSSGRGRFLRVEPAGPRLKKAYIVFDNLNQDDLAVLEMSFASGAPGNVFAALQFEKVTKRLIHLLFNGNGAE